MQNKKYALDRTVVVIPPYANKSTDGRPWFMDSLSKSDQISKTGEWTTPPEHYFELFSAIIREKFNHEVDRKIKLVNCPINESNCLYDSINRKSINFYVLSPKDYESRSLRIPTNPLVIDISSLTSHPVKMNFIVNQPNFTEVETSSFDLYDASGLLDSTAPGWHAEREPKYPQKIIVSYKEPINFSSISFLPQDQYLAARGPKDISIKISNDRYKWKTIVRANNICESNTLDGWHKVNLPNKITSRYIEIEIFSNCGDPEHLTLRGLKIN